MNEIFFLIFAFLTVFLSIKLSIYADNLSKTSNISKAVIGGLLLAGVTSLPELITCTSAVLLKNPLLAIGDILGSNLFNIFITALLDIIFIKKIYTTKTTNTNYLTYLILIINYLTIYLFIKDKINITILNIGLPTIVIIILYLIYIKLLPKNKEEQTKTKIKPIKNIKEKLLITSILMISSSVLLTTFVNNIAGAHPSFSSGIIGAILLGITTSLPEVITFYTLISIDNYDLALQDIIGSNLFNLVVLSFTDIIYKTSPIYNEIDNNTTTIIFLGLIFIIISFLQNIRTKSISKLTYIIPSIIIVSIYIYFWFIGFI